MFFSKTYSPKIRFPILRPLKITSLNTNNTGYKKTSKTNTECNEEIINTEERLISNYSSNLLRWNEEDIRLAAYDLSIAISMKKINIYI